MGKYTELVNNIVKNIGGVDNINTVTHCVTRLRFYLRDESKANDDIVKNIDGVVTVVKSAGQYQIVIGNHVPDVYKEVLDQTGLSTDREAPKTKKKAKDIVFEYIMAIMGPSIGILSASGIIQGLNSICVVTGIYAQGSSMQIMVDAIGKGMMHFFPIFISYNIASKTKMNRYLAMAIGAILCMPTINGVDLTFFGHTINASYTQTVFPALLIILVASPVERFFNKVIPDVVKTFLTPVCVLLTVVPVGFLLIGPAANQISIWLSMGINQLINLSPIVAGFVSGALWQVLVLFGVHMMLIIPSISNLMAGIPDQFMAYIGVVSFAQTAVVIAIWLKTKNKKLREIAFPAWVSGIFGVTEPAIYGVTLPRIKYFIISCIGAACGGAVAGALDVQRVSMAGLGVFSFPGYISVDAGMKNMNGMLISIAVAVALSFIATYVIYKDEDEAPQPDAPKKEKGGKDVIMSPLSGDVVELTKVSDPAFSTETLGKGLAVNPKEGTVYAPCDGHVTVMFPTKHAVGIVSEQGTEVLIHIGMDTVQLDGKFFESHVNQGDRVKVGQPLVSFDIEAIKNEGYSVVTPVIITNTNDYLDVVSETVKTINHGEQCITAIFK
ncbi:PTS beta-glucoside transporter subunit IIABC [Erysipelothrix larvae]|uniref:PTS beta-glucoside transporter subunit IIABC n=1 Tax=Erysipelothrix larvae TaxID=1514105 RepID=A0A0X8GY24_9FIRM|nr:beta-glucoside-specific PTS transporter subunit IIABC [Erysipelothrix larvae]AMC92532.1 PTS beta-glucoside transporter subunit IIABC [Erysipelothrix larvae]